MKEEVLEAKEVKEKNKRLKNYKGIDGFVLSIVSMITVFFWYLSIPAAIYGMVMSILAVRSTGSKLGKAGFIIALVALTLCVAIYSQMMFTIIRYF